MRNTSAKCWWSCRAWTLRARTAPYAACSTTPTRWASAPSPSRRPARREGTRLPVAHPQGNAGAGRNRRSSTAAITRMCWCRGCMAGSSEECKRRYAHIRDFERMLAETGTVIVKFFLHISKDEQKARLQARLDDPQKHWKFDPQDLEERKFWGDYQDAYTELLWVRPMPTSAVVRDSSRLQDPSQSGGGGRHQGNAGRIEACLSTAACRICGTQGGISDFDRTPVLERDNVESEGRSSGGKFSWNRGDQPQRQVLFTTMREFLQRCQVSSFTKISAA